MAFYRAYSPLCKQTLKNNCWAAALDSISRITPRLPYLDENSLVARYGDLTKDGCLNLPMLFAFSVERSRFEVRRDFVDKGTPIKSSLEERLRKSHIILIYNVSGSDWHAWVVYGLDDWGFIWIR